MAYSLPLRKSVTPLEPEPSYEPSNQHLLAAGVWLPVQLGKAYSPMDVVATGMGVAMMLAATEVTAGHMTVGDVVMVQGLIHFATIL